eukprot:14202_1
MPSVFIWFVLLSHRVNGSSFTCTGYEECLNIQCNDDQDCFVACVGNNACQTANISAPSNANLYVECSYPESCYDTTVFGSSIGNLFVNCTGTSYTCRKLEIHGPTNGDATVICDGHGIYDSCHNAHIYCPIYGDCNVQCDGQKACWFGFRLDAQSMINGTLSLHSVSG